MFRVPEDTVLRRAAATLLLVLASASLAACGSDDKGAATATTAAASATASTPTPTTPVKVDLSIKPSATEEGPKAIAAASTKKITQNKNKAQARRAAKAVKAAGLGTAKVVSSGPTLTTLFVDGMSVAFFSTEKAAAESAYQYQQMIESRPGFGHIARTKNRVYIVSSGKGVTKDQVATFDQLRSTIDQAL